MSSQSARTAEPIVAPRRQPRRLLVALACLLIVMLGASMRLSGSDWDRGSNLHPDERHLMFVITDTMRDWQALPPDGMSPYSLWFATGKSPLDPRRNGQIYVYGEFPHLVTALVARLTGTDGWPPILRLGRTLGAIVDAYTILAVFLLSMQVLRSGGAALAAAAFYAFCPLALQLSNFFAVDIWLTGAAAWCTLAATIGLGARTRRAALAWFVLAGALAGLALACKLPGVLLGGVVGGAALLRFWRDGRERSMKWLVLCAVSSLAAAMLALRLAAPFTFLGPGFFGFDITPAVIAGYVEMSRLVLDFGFPPNWQWMTGYGPLNALVDMAVWGLGPIIGLALVLGAFVVARRRALWAAAAPLLVLIVPFSAYWLAGAAPALRYAAPILPALCVLAAGGALVTPRGVSLLAGIGAFVWGTGMVGLHGGLHSRIAASEWMWQNLPAGTVVANESSWDDGLPSAVRVNARGDLLYGDVGGHFTSVALAIDLPDNAEKAHTIATRLAGADVLAISSERMRKPILALGSRFPMTTRYYRMLESGELCFALIYQNKPGYTVLGQRFDDSWAQEPWSIYDHPQVEIYRKLDCYDAGKVEEALLQALPKGS
ncbi:glycosyltransferase family 39 protein [Devosia sp. A16]|uniref:glycosyltransferase family 39 protein n=1 Tax=Devosia sp. A16 TaxID=1736675 RepID=UPI0006D83579|nr:glycosyltransferase family 39 protein [Devosia sp. A16]